MSYTCAFDHILPLGHCSNDVAAQLDMLGFKFSPEPCSRSASYYHIERPAGWKMNPRKDDCGRNCYDFHDDRGRVRVQAYYPSYNPNAPCLLVTIRPFYYPSVEQVDAKTVVLSIGDGNGVVLWEEAITMTAPTTEPALTVYFAHLIERVNKEIKATYKDADNPLSYWDNP